MHEHNYMHIYVWYHTAHLGIWEAANVKWIYENREIVRTTTEKKNFHMGNGRCKDVCINDWICDVMAVVVVVLSRTNPMRPEIVETIKVEEELERSRRSG